MIFTSYYANYSEMNGVCISRSKPKGYICLECKELFPDWSLVNNYKNKKITKREYRKAYIKQLKQLNVDKYASLLDNKVLLCYEKSEDFCHRHIVAEWFNRSDYKCEELPKKGKYSACLWCKHMVSSKGINICKNTGEVLIDIKNKTCADWRYVE